ncbi:MAG: hypothetical protein C4337_03515 [Armatimonadota bacterium]
MATVLRHVADVNGALSIYQREFQVSPIKGRSGRVARPVVLSLHLGWHEPERRDKALRASGIRMSLH